MSYQMIVLVESLEIAEKMSDQEWQTTNSPMSRAEYIVFISDQILNQSRFEYNEMRKRKAA